jgi:hypothetical protein
MTEMFGTVSDQPNEDIGRLDKYYRLNRQMKKCLKREMRRGNLVCEKERKKRKEETDLRYQDVARCGLKFAKIN